MNPGIVDFHTHYYPESVFRNPKAFADQQSETHWKALVAPEGKTTLQDWANARQMLDQMDRAGIRHAVLLGWYWENDETAILQNRWYAELIQSHPDRFSAFASLPPVNRGNRMKELEFALSNGFKGIGELHPAVQGYELLGDAFREVVEFSQAHELMINLHVTEPVGRPYTPKEPTEFADFHQLVEAYPEQVWILSHWGGLILFHELNPYIRKRWGNVYYDISATPLLYQKAVFPLAVRAVGADKILFGTDFPLRVFPRLQKEADFQKMVEWVQLSDLTETEQQSIFEGNARRLLDEPN